MIQENRAHQLDGCSVRWPQRNSSRLGHQQGLSAEDSGRYSIFPDGSGRYSL